MKKLEGIKRLISALRSGKYKQAKGRLQNNKGYCCLGVACNLTIPHNKLDIKYRALYGSEPYDQIYAPKWLKKLNQDFSDKTKIEGNHRRVSLMHLNDTGYLNEVDEYIAENLNFNEIADMLELVYLYKAFENNKVG